MNKKIVTILTLTVISAVALVGCGNKTKAESAPESATVSDSIPDTVFQVSSAEDETSDTSSEENNDNKTKSNVNDKSENKEVQSSNNSVQDKKKEKPKNESSNTTASTKKEEKTVSTKATIFTAQAGYTLTFPANWEGKYIIEEKPDILTVRYKCSSGTPNPLLFAIERDSPDNDYDFFDRVGNIRFFNVGDTRYCVGGPTDCWDGTGSSSDYQNFITINRQKSEVVNSLKVIR